MSQRIVVTGTDAGIGKSFFSAGLAHLLGANYWKPIQAGVEGETDSEQVARLSGLPADRIVPERYRLKTSALPHHRRNRRNSHRPRFARPAANRGATARHRRRWRVDGAAEF